jgi:hypothetical protein
MFATTLIRSKQANPPNLKRRNLLQEDATYTYSNIIRCHKKIGKQTNNRKKKWCWPHAKKPM